MPSPRSELFQPLLSDRVAELLKQKIISNAFGQSLPSERQLAADLAVSRGTIRVALDILHARGVIGTPDSTKARRILSTSRKALSRQRARRLGVLISSPRSKLMSDDAAWCAEIEAGALSRGWECAFHDVGEPRAQDLKARLGNLVLNSAADFWIISVLVWRPVLHWFHLRGLPALGMGASESPDGPTISYDVCPCIDHALGVLVRAGRKRITVPCTPHHSPRFLGRLRKSFADRRLPYIPAFNSPTYELGREEYCGMLQRLFDSPEPPDAIVCTYTLKISAMLVQGWLAKRRLCCPDDVSLIQIGNDPCFDYMFPALAHYRSDAAPLARAALKLTEGCFRTGKLPRGWKTLLPEYVPGATV